MRKYISLLCFICCPPVLCRNGNSAVHSFTSVTSKEKNSSRSSVDKIVDNLFCSTDINNDGRISFDEAYSGCLLLYIQLNRQAPLNPPSREKIALLYLQADNDKSNLLDREQYGILLKKLVRRALLRLTTHKIVTWVGAPLLTEVIVRSLASQQEGLEGMLRFVVPSIYHDSVIPVLTSRSFHRSLWMVILVVTLGNICLGFVNFLLDLTLPDPRSFSRRWMKTLDQR